MPQALLVSLEPRHGRDWRVPVASSALGLVLAAIVSLAPGIAFAESTPEGTTVIGVRAGQACLRESIRITGFALAREESGAGILADGYRITQILVAEGDKVAAGQELIRAAILGGDDGAAAAQGRPASMSARAPIAGVVTRIEARVGMVTGGGMAAGPGGAPAPQIRISADSGIDLLVDVPSLHVTKIRAGAVARVIRGDGAEAKGVVRAAVSEVDPATQLGKTRLSIDPASALRPGQFASAVIETARDCGLSVPRSAVVYQNGATTVQVLNGGKVETRSVRTGLSDDTTIQIREGLVEGEPVVADSGAALRPGDRVTPVIAGGDGAKGR